MKILKKIISSLLLIIFISYNLSFNISLADDWSKNLILKEIIISKHKLKNIVNGENFITKIDDLISKIENIKDKEKLNQLKNIVDKKIYELSFNNDLKSENIVLILTYLQTNISLVIYNIESDSSINTINEMLESNLSDEEKQDIENQIIDLQLNLFERWTNYFDSLIKDFDKLTNYEDNGELNINLDLDYDEIWKINSSFNLQNYSTKNSNFDSELNWQIEAIIDASLKWEEDFKLQLSTFIDFISKDWNIYVLLDKLNITNETQNEELKDFIDTLTKIAQENKYVKIENKESTQAIKYLKNLNPSNIISNWKETLSKAMFEAYKKDSDKYLLKPTRYACDKLKEIKEVFDPFYNDNKCSDSQYKDMLESIAEIWEFYIIPWEEKQLWFYWNQEDSNIMWFIIFNDTKILEANANLIPDQNKYPNEWFELSYKSNEKLYAKLYADSWEINYIFDSKLDNNNNFTYISLKWHTTSKSGDFALNIGLENNKISWAIEYNDNKYDWESSEYFPDTNIKSEISWTTDSQNKLSSLIINTKWKTIEDNKEFLNSNFTYNSWELSFDNNINSNYFSSQLKLSWKWDATNNILNKWDFYLNINEKSYWSDEYNEIFKTDLKLENKIISGTSYISDWIDKLAEINHTWKYEKDYFELKNHIEIEKNPFTQYITWENNNIEKIIWNINIMTDLRNNSQNSKLSVDINLDENKIFEFEINNKAIRTYKDTEIKTPIDTINLEEIMEK